MRVGFYVPAFDHLGIAYLSACLKRAGHETVAFFDPRICNDAVMHNRPLARLFNMESWVVDRILDADVDLLAFSVVTDNFVTARRIAAKVRARRSIVTVFGGIHCTSIPYRVVENPEVDYMIVGEGDEAVVDLADALDAGKREFEIANVWYKDGNRVVSPPCRRLVENLDALPFPDKDLFYNAAPKLYRARYNTAASRGCPYSCTYCNNSLLRKLYQGKGHWRRRRSVDNVIAELRQALDKYHYRMVQFWDELFVDNEEWLEEFAAKYPNAIGKPFFCWGHPRRITEKTVAALEKAGCREMNVGVQTTRENTRRAFLKRIETNDDVVRAIHLLKESRIFVSTGNILGLPGQTVDEGLEMAAFYNENRVDLPYVYFLRYYPGTEIVDIAREAGLLTDREVIELETPTVDGSIFNTSQNTPKDLVRIRTLIQLTAILPKSVMRKMMARGWWRWLPAISFYHCLFLLGYLLRRITSGKRRFVENYTALRYLQLMAIFGLKKLCWNATRVLRRRPKRQKKTRIAKNQES